MNVDAEGETLPSFVLEDSRVLHSHRPAPDTETAARNLALHEAKRPHWLRATETKENASTPFPSLTEGPISEKMGMNLPDSIVHERANRIAALILARKGYSANVSAVADLIRQHYLDADHEIIRRYALARSAGDLKATPMREPLLRVTPGARQGWTEYEYPFEVSETPYPLDSRRAASFEEFAAYSRLHPSATASEAARAVGRSQKKLLMDIGSGAIKLKKGDPMELNELNKGQLVTVHNFLASKATGEKPAAVKGFKSNDTGMAKVSALVADYATAGNDADVEAILKAATKWGKRQAAKSNGDGASAPKAKVAKKAASEPNVDENGYRVGSVRAKAYAFMKARNFRAKFKELIVHLYGSVEDGKSAINGVLRGFDTDGLKPEKEKVDGETYLTLQAS